jgi:hypothetical protein
VTILLAVPDRHAITEPVARPVVDIADETYLAVAPEVLAPVVGDTGSWIVWWPDLVPRMTRDRGAKGVQWAVTGALRGSMEVWLEAVAGGTVVHWYVRAEPSRARSAGAVRRDRERRIRSWKRHMFALKDSLEGVKAEGGSAESP